MRRVGIAGLLGTLSLLIPAPAQATVWLCAPHVDDDPCRSDLTATVVKRSGATRVERAQPARRPRVDCFYVYPTISDQPTTNANFDRDPPLRGVARAQASRFSQQCRLFAPVYRQVTIPALLLRQAGVPTPQSARDLAYGDVRAAWRDYLANHNRGRGVVLIGHSQGAGMLIRLVQDEIDRRPGVRRRLVSALLIGGNVVVGKRRDAGGDFRNVEACRSDRRLGCVVAYSAYRTTPRGDALFGRVERRSLPGRNLSRLEVLCTDPARLARTRALIPYVPTERIPGIVGTQTDEPPDAPTPWVKAPRLYGSECQSIGGADFLRVFPFSAGDPRDIASERPTQPWGLHLVDVNVALGNLVMIVKRQVELYLERRG